MMNDLRFKVDELFSNLVDADEHTLLLLDHGKRLIYKAGYHNVLVYFTDKNKYINYAIINKRENSVKNWQYVRARHNTVESWVTDIYGQYIREG